MNVEDAIDRMVRIHDHEIPRAFADALNRCGPINKPAGPYWQKLAKLHGEAAELADQIGNVAVAR